MNPFAYPSQPRQRHHGPRGYARYESYRDWRHMIALLEELETRRPDLHAVWLGYPDDLPDLTRLRPPGGNSRPAGIEQCHLARQKRGKLSASY